LCPTVAFFLSDLDIARAGAEARRRWLDAAIVQLNPQHWPLLTAYEKVRRQKAQLLKLALQGPVPDLAEQLAVWNTQLVQYAVPILTHRWQYVQAITPLAQGAYAALTPQHPEPFNMAYAVRWQPDPSGQYEHDDWQHADMPTTHQLTMPDWAPMLWQALTHHTRQEQARASCVVGPHRDDVALWLNHQPVDSFGSQGQQRSVVLALKHAELTHLYQQTGEYPLLLLDDVMAELDPMRQRFLLDWFNPEGQVLITTTHADATWTHRLPGNTKAAVQTLDLTQTRQTMIRDLPQSV
jgi:DNA replication and repair protein RecF